MPRIVKLADLNKKERKKIQEQTKNEVEERKSNIQNQISFKNNNRLPVNNSQNNFQLPVNNRVQNYSTTSKFPITNNINRNNVGQEQKNTSQKVFEALNPGKKINYDNDSKSEIHMGGVLPYIAKNYKQGLFEGTAGIAQGQILSASNEAKKISEQSNKDKFKNLNETFFRTLNPIYGIAKKSFEMGQNTLNTLKDKDKTAKQKVTEILTNSVSGVKDLNNPISDVVKLSGKTAGLINKDSGDKLLELNEKIDKPLRENREKLQEEGQNYSNAVRMAGTVSNVVGNMTPSIIASRLGGGNEALSQALSLGTMGLSVKGRATQEALSKGAELDKAIKIGDTKAMTEVGTELLTGGLNIFGKGALDNIVERGINKKVTNNVLNYLAKQGVGIAGEVGEETISDILNTVIDQGTVDPKATYSMKDWSDTALTTMLSTVVLNALGGAYTPKAYNQNVQEVEQYKAKQDITERINNSNLSEEDRSNMLNYVQNEDFTQADYNAMRETIENSEQPTDTISQEQISSLVARIDKSNLPNEDKLMMKDYIQNNNVSQADIDSMNNVIDSAVSIPANNELVTNQNFKDNVEARKKYTKYKNDTGEYNSKAINEVLDIIPENRNGNRTVKQWLQVAKETGTRIADLSNEEIERIAYKSWFDVQPSKNITKYDRQSKSTVGFQKLTSDEWINEINRAVNEARNNNQTQDVANNQEIQEVSKKDAISKEIPTSLVESAKQQGFKYKDMNLSQIQKALDNKGIKSRFDETEFSNENEGAKWKLTRNEDGTVTREIILNPKANEKTVVQEMAIHELTHDIVAKNTKTSEKLYNEVKNWLKNDTDYKNQLENLKEIYGEDLAEEEAIAKTLQTKFGNQEEINNLVNYNPSMARKIYDWVVDKLNKITGGRIEKLYWEDVKNKFERAYSEEGNYNNSETKYSIAGKKALENLKNTKLYDQALNTYKKARNMAKQGKSNKDIMDQTGWFKDDTGKLKFSFSDKDMDLKNINFQENKLYNLGDILKHDTLFTFYPQLKKYKVEFKDLNKNRATKYGKINGSYSRLDKGIRLDINRANSKIDTEGTLIHEIQHAIQDIEGFTGGTSRKLGKRAYKKSIGEIEARDTANRFYLEKYNDQELSDVLPESAKLDRNILEKMKDGLYNYFEKISGGTSNEEINTETKENSNRNRILVEKRINDNTNNTIKNTVSKDNQGRTLTKEQQEYFKNSKVRDEDGNLLTMYHGTDADFNVFKYDNLGKTGKAYGDGFYFTDSIEGGKTYGKNLKEVYLDIRKPMEIGKTTMSKAEYKSLIEAINNETNGTITADYGSVENALKTYDYGGDDIDLIYELKNASGLKLDRFYEIVRNTLGYDGIKANNKTNGKDGNFYIVFNANQIKNTNNINPTLNQDIRYSKSTDIIKDNRGNTLNKRQQEYFKNTKAVDSNGNIEVVYHGTNKAGFTEFKRVFNYYTNNKDVAQSYTRGTEMVDTKKLESVSDAKSWLKGITDELYIENNNIYEYDGEKLLSYKTEEDLLKNLKRDIQEEIGDTEAGGVYEGYVNITKPITIDAKNERWSMIDIDNISIDGINNVEQFLKDYGSSVWKEKGKLRTSTNDIVVAIQEAIEEGKIDADGIIIKNIYDEGGYGNITPTESGTDYITFNSNQFKAIDNINPSNSSDIRYSDNGNFDQYIENRIGKEGIRTTLGELTNNNTKDIISEKSSMPMNEKQEQEKVAQILEKPQQQVKEKDRTWAILKAGLLDKGIVFEELSHKTKNRELQSKWDYTLSATARGQNAIGNARYEFDPKTKKQKQISKSLEDIRAEVGDRVSDFNQYMYHLLNIDRMTLEERFGGDTGTNFENNGNITNKPVFSKDISADISRGIVEKLENKHSDFKDIAQDVYDYNNANKQELVRNGVISQELSDKLAEMYPHYVPIKRVDVKGSAIKVPLDTNRTGINSPLARATGGNSDIQPLFETMADRTMQTYRAGARNNFGVELLNTLNSQIESNNVDVDTIIDEIGSEDTELLKEGKNGENPTFTVFNNGEKTTFEITKDMYDALKPISDGSLLNKKILKGIPNKISNLRRGVLTEYNPLFSITNALKDAQDVIVNSQHTAKTFSKFPEAYSQILNKGYWYKEYVQNGGEQNSYFKDGEFTSDKKVPTAKKALSVPLNAVSNVNNIIEMAPRLAEYIASREAGRSVETSMLDASRVTTNFKAGGDITKFANRNGATFLNASVQGFQQQIRNIKEANVKGLKGYAVLAGKYTVAGVIPAIINSLIWKDDKDYEDLQDYVKDNYYCIAKLGDGKFIRIPKGRMVATLQKIVSNIGEHMTDDKKLNIDNFAKDFWEDLKFGMDNVAPNNPLDNNVISPVIQAISNKSWYGEDIVPSRLQKKPDAQQYDETTDSLSKWLGEKLNKSPYKINYLLDQYSGGVGDIVLPMMTKQAENNAIEDKFTTDSVMKSKYPGKFFELKDQLETNNVSDYATDEDKLKYKYINEISSELSDLYNKKREIQNSNMSDKDKKAKLKEVQKDINIIAKDGIDNVGKIKVDKNTATIDDKQYYKYKDEWTELSDKDKEKAKNISLSTFADYRNKVYELTKQKKESEENIKSEDKIQLLLDSKYSNKDKEELYKNYIGSNDSIFNTIKSSGMNIDEYLKYRQKNLNKEKKDVVIRYLNSMNITGNQRLLLYALHRYKTDNNQKNQLVKYVKNLDMNNEEKLKLISKFSGFKVYKNGKITY